MRNLISEEYKQQITELHNTEESWGVASVHYAPIIGALINKLVITNVLDYGAGKGRLGSALREHVDHKITMTKYDPAIEGIDEPPDPSELVCCIDVLEHIEPEFLEEVLDDLVRVTERLAFVTIGCGPARRILPDGRNAHLIIQPPWWWMDKLSSRFHIGQFSGNFKSFMVMLKPKL